MKRKQYTPDADFESGEFTDLIESIRSVECREPSGSFERNMDAKIRALHPSPLRKLWADIREYFSVVNAAPARIAVAYGVPLILCAVIGVQLLRSPEAAAPEAGLKPAQPPAGPTAQPPAGQPGVQPGVQQPAADAAASDRNYEAQFADVMSKIREAKDPEPGDFGRGFSGHPARRMGTDMQDYLNAIESALERDDFESARAAFKQGIRAAEQTSGAAYNAMASAYLARGDRKTAALLYWKASTLGHRQAGRTFETLKTALDAAPAPTE